MSLTKKYIGYVGTYTKGESKGIYSFTLDEDAQMIKDVKVAAELENPTYLTISRDNKFLYSIVKEEEFGGIAAYSVNEKTGELTAINSQATEGAPPCHVSVSSDNRHVFSANYHKGTVESYLINEEDGSLNPASSIIEHHGSGPDPRQEKPHTHYAAFTPDEKFVTVVELGSDMLYTYEIKDGELKEKNRLSIKPGSGPRHIVFHPNEKYAYIMTEFSSEVIVLTYKHEEGSFSEEQYISTIPGEFTENNQGSAIHISSDGKFLYAGNRGHNSIAVFKVDQATGRLSFIENTSTEGNWPRDFSLNPSEDFLIASNQESNNLVLFSRDKTTGKLTLLQPEVNVPHPVCVKFLHE